MPICPPVLDEIDRQLIAALQINARESVAMLARQLGIARTTVTSRLARLEKTKVITGYGVRLGQRVVDGGLQAYVGITVQPRSGKEVLRRLSAMAQVQQLCAVSGEFDYVAWLRTDSPEQLDQLLDQIGSVDGVEKTTTSIIFSSKIGSGQPILTQHLRQHSMTKNRYANPTTLCVLLTSATLPKLAAIFSYTQTGRIPPSRQQGQP